MLAPAIIVSVAVPLVFLLAVKRLNLYATDRFDMIVVSFFLGVASFIPAYIINTAFVKYMTPVLGVKTAMNTLRTTFAPIVEEIVKSSGPAYTIWHRHFSYIVDGAIYGFAAGTGFAVLENINYVQGLGANAGLALSINRAFSTSLMHGTSVAIVGASLGRLRFSKSPTRTWVFPLGYVAAIALHMIFNRVVTSDLPPSAILFTAIGIGFAGLGFIAWVVSRGLAEERSWLHETLSDERDVSEAEMEIAEHMTDLHILVDPVGERFGHEKEEQVEALIRLDAQLGLTEEAFLKAEDPELREQLEEDVEDLRKQVKDMHRKIGPYCMTYVRSIHPDDSHSIWERVRANIADEGEDYVTTVHQIEHGVAKAAHSVESVIERTVERFEEVIEEAEEDAEDEAERGSGTDADEVDSESDS